MKNKYETPYDYSLALECFFKGKNIEVQDMDINFDTDGLTITYKF